MSNKNNGKGNKNNATFIRYDGKDDVINYLVLSHLSNLAANVDLDWYRSLFDFDKSNASVIVTFGLPDILEYYKPYHDETISFQMTVDECMSPAKSWNIEIDNLAKMADYYTSLVRANFEISKEQEDKAEQLFLQLTNKLFVRGTKNYSQVYPGFVTKLKNVIIDKVHHGDKSKLKHLAPVTEYHCY